MTLATHDSREVFTHFLPTLFEPAELRGGTAVVIDVLRASTTICHALDAGANAVVPCGEVDDALRLQREFAAENPILGGERHGKLIDGFDLDNSPFRYTPETVAGRTVIFTTTNGTRALLRSAEADRILIGAFSNLNSVVQALRLATGPIHLVCAGTQGRITEEDVLCAGAIACGLWHFDHDSGPGTDFRDDPTRMAATLFRTHSSSLVDALKKTRGGRNCLSLGFDADVARAAELNRFELLPCYSPRTGRITTGDR